MREAVATFVARAATKLQRKGLACSHLSVFVRTNPFNADDRQYSTNCSMRLAVETGDTPESRGRAMTLVRPYRGGYRRKKAGVLMVEPVPRRAERTRR